MRLRRKLALLLAVVMALPLAGCWDRAELEEQAFVLAIGVDKGKESQYAVTAAIALPAKMAGGGKGGGGGDEKPFVLTTVEAPTVAGAMAMINAYVDRRVSLLHTKALFMGEELARISGMYTMDEFVRFRQARRTIFYVVTKGRAADFLKEMDPKMEKDPQKFIQQMTYNYRYTGMIPASSQVQSFVTSVNSGYGDPITYYAAIKEESEGKSGDQSATAESGFKSGELPRKGGPNMELVGGAAFSGEKMVGVLTGDEMRTVLMLQDKFQRGYFSVPDPKQPNLFVSLDLRRGRAADVKVDLSGPRPHITGVVTLEGEILAIQANYDYTDPQLMQTLQGAAERHLQNQIQATVRKSQNWGADIFGFGQHVVRQFPTVQAWEAYNWPSRYKDAQVDVAVRVILRRFGVQMSPPKAKTK